MLSNSISSIPVARWQPETQSAGGALLRNAKASPDYAEKLAKTLELLSSAASNFQPISLACSLGAEDMVLLHMLHAAQLPCDVFVLQTGKLNPETLDLLELVQKIYGSARSIKAYEPDALAAAEFVASNGEDAMYKSIELRKACCGIRKMVPLAAALKGQRAWITGLRREQSNARAEVPLQEADGEHDGLPREKFNPLAEWTWGDVWHYIQTNAVPYNALHDQFYPSIGCQPCTRAVTLGEDFRSGRWWWEQAGAKECGLHVK